MGFHSLEIGKSALLAANYGLQVTGQNLSNVNTTGYSRQTVNQNGAKGVSSGSQLLGSGVNVQSITRVANTYAEKQLRTATSDSSYHSALDNAYTNVENYFTELTGNALSDNINNFQSALSDLSTHLETLSNRTTVLEEAEALTDRFNEIGDSLREYRQSINSEVEDSVAQINNLLNTIAALNKAIVGAESGGLSCSTANDLRDQRGEALRQLSEMMNCEVTEESNGSCIVSVNGRNMVYFDQVYDLSIKYEKSGDILAAVPCFSSDGHPVRAESGTLAAQVEIRDTILKSYIDELDQLAASFTWELNKAYSQTRGSEPFDSITSLNSPRDPSVTLDQLSFRESVPEGTFQIVNGTLEMAVYNHNTGQETTVKIEIDLDGRLGPDGEPDMILWDPSDPDASNSFINRLQTALDQAVPGAFKVSIDNDWKVGIESLSDDYGFSFSSDTSGVLAALGINTLFTGFNASTIGVNENLYANPEHFGVSNSSQSGDNSGVLDLLSFFDTGLDRLGSQTVEDAYKTMVGRLGGEASRVESQACVASDVLLRMFNQRESISGVSEDEEALNLITYQRAYQSAAKYLGIVDELYETLINL